MRAEINKQCKLYFYNIVEVLMESRMQQNRDTKEQPFTANKWMHANEAWREDEPSKNEN